MKRVVTVSHIAEIWVSISILSGSRSRHPHPLPPFATTPTSPMAFHIDGDGCPEEVYRKPERERGIRLTSNRLSVSCIYLLLHGANSYFYMCTIPTTHHHRRCRRAHKQNPEYKSEDSIVFSGAGRVGRLPCFR